MGNFKRLLFTLLFGFAMSRGENLEYLLNPSVDKELTIKTKKGTAVIDLLEKEAPEIVREIIFAWNNGCYKGVKVEIKKPQIIAFRTDYRYNFGNPERFQENIKIPKKGDFVLPPDYYSFGHPCIMLFENYPYGADPVFGKVTDGIEFLEQSVVGEELFFDIREKSQAQDEQTQNQYEDEQAGPNIYGIDEWVKVASDDCPLEWKIDEAYRKRIEWSDMWRAAGLTFERLSPQDISDMQSRYLDFVVLRLITRGTSNKEQWFDLADFPICYPYNCPMYKGGDYQTVLKILNGNSSSSRRVTRYTPDTAFVPYLIYTNVGGDPSEWQRIPEGILRIGTDMDGGKRQVEIGSFKD